jgi:heme/copper-type cytochrome/quinol oxidase subunit 4
MRFMTRNEHHEVLTERREISPPSEKSFGITFAVVLALLSAWLLLRKGLASWALFLFILAMAFLGAAFARPILLSPVNRAWFSLGLILHRIVNPVVMGLLFFLVFTPTGMIMRLMGKDLLRLKRIPKESTYWIHRDAKTDPLTNMKKQY